MLKITTVPSPTNPLPFKVNEQLNIEDILAHASELLRCASATAYECGDSLKGSQRDMAFSVMHLVQMASAMVDKSLDQFSTR